MGKYIAEASATSGTLAQARAALDQGRKRFIPGSNFHDPSITGPRRVRDVDDILREFEVAVDAAI